MPIFDFACKRCGHEFEVLIVGDKEQPPCPACESKSVIRMPVSLFSCTGVQMTKQLRMDSEERMKKGSEWMKGQKFRKDRIKIL